MTISVIFFVDHKISEVLKEHLYMSKEGKLVESSRKLWRKVIHKLTRPEMCAAFDETEGNTSQEKDGQVGNAKLCAP